MRRYEYYQYAGVYDPITHEALCADLTCTAPSPGELGDAIGAQNAAANLDVNALTVSVTGGGSVSSADKVFSCGNKCYGVYAQGATVTLTAKANSGSAFTSWGGACAGNLATCTVSMGAEKTVTALFTTVAAGGVAVAVVVAVAVAVVAAGWQQPIQSLSWPFQRRHSAEQSARHQLRQQLLSQLRCQQPDYADRNPTSRAGVPGLEWSLHRHQSCLQHYPD